MNSVASIKDRLKNKSRETGRTLQEIQSFLTPMIDFITGAEDCPGHWLHEQQKWV